MAQTQTFSPTLRSNLTIAAFVGAASVLSMSGRMPALWHSFARWGLRLGSAIEARLSIDFVDRNDLGFGVDEVGHLILWASGMVVIGLIARHRFRADVIAVCLFGASLALELAQGAFASGRSMAVGDVIANATGIMVGLSVVVVVGLAIKLGGRVAA
jgi:hypothetical protein